MFAVVLVPLVCSPEVVLFAQQMQIFRWLPAWLSWGESSLIPVLEY